MPKRHEQCVWEPRESIRIGELSQIIRLSDSRAGVPVTTNKSTWFAELRLSDTIVLSGCVFIEIWWSRIKVMDLPKMKCLWFSWFIQLKYGSGHYPGKTGCKIEMHLGWDTSCLLMWTCFLCICLFRKTAGTHGTEKTESSSGTKTKREAENDGTDEVSFGKKAKLETVLSEDIKYACIVLCISVVY